MADYILDKGLPVLSTYNSSAAGGVTAFRVVKWNGSPAANVDLATAATDNIAGVVQENVDQAKVATGKVIADVRMLGVSKVYVAASGTAPVVGDKVTAGAGGGVVKVATGGTNLIIGRVLGPLNQTIGNGDLIDVLMLPSSVAQA